MLWDLQQQVLIFLEYLLIFFLKKKAIPVVFNHNGIVAGIVLLFLGGLFSGLYY